MPTVVLCTLCLLGNQTWTTYILTLIIMIWITPTAMLSDKKIQFQPSHPGFLAAESCQLCYLSLITIYPVSDKISAMARIRGLLSAGHAHSQMSCHSDMTSWHPGGQRWRTQDCTVRQTHSQTSDGFMYFMVTLKSWYLNSNPVLPSKYEKKARGNDQKLTLFLSLTLKFKIWGREMLPSHRDIIYYKMSRQDQIIPDWDRDQW